MALNVFQQLYHNDLDRSYKNFDGVILDNIIGDIPDIQNYLEKIHGVIGLKGKILISYHNPIWEPILNLASNLGLRKRFSPQNWVDQADLKNLLNISGYEIIASYKRFFEMTIITTAKPIRQLPITNHKFTVSIIIAAKNEEGNIAKIIPSIPKFGKSQEMIFVEGYSKDKTWKEIKSETQKRKNVFAFKQTGKGKANAIQLGISKARGDIVIIYDADRTIDARDLIKFYKVLASGSARFANGSRLVYPMEKDAMRTLNKIGNKIFSILFTQILGTRFKDTLCGTKVFFRKDFIKYSKDYHRYLKTDPFGDFALIFTAIKHKIKIIEIPVRYKERVYGSTNINRFYHGLLLAKMTILGFWEFKILS